MAYFKCAFSNSGATLTVECDSFMAGAIVTCSNGVKTLQGLCPSTSPYEVTFKIPEEGTWVVSTTISGATYSTSVDIDFSFEASLSGFNWMRWLTEGGLDPSDYNDFSEVLADEKALRQLNLVHASVDYMASIIATHPDVETIIAEGLFAKWANLSDYALDKMEANAVLSDLMDDADLYGYGELIEDNGTWKPKGNVPIMTSNSAPYGEAYADSTYQSSAYQAFDGDDTTQWYSPNDSAYVQYKHTNPILAKKAYVKFKHASARQASNTFTIKGSNDGSTWDTLGTYTNTHYGEAGTFEVEIELNSSNYHLYHRLDCVKTNTGDSGYGESQIIELQFYGRELKASVPTMTSNTAPYGEASASVADSGYEAYKAFDGNNSTYWFKDGGVGQWVQYDFKRPVRLTQLYAMGYGVDNCFKDVEIYGVQNQNATKIADLTFENVASLQKKDIDNNVAYTGFRFKIVADHGAVINNAVKTLQFYGKDYSEKEFANDGSKWLYDHGVYPTNNELEEISDYEGSPYVNRGVINDIGGTGFDIDTSVTASSFKTLGFKNSEVLTTNNLLRMRNNIYNLYGADACLDISSISGSNYIAFESFTSQGGVAGSAMLVTSAKHSSPELARKSANGHVITVHEVWLE